MKKVAVVTDSNAGIRQKRSKRTWYFCFANAFYYWWSNILWRYKFNSWRILWKQLNGAEIFTSQPVVGNVKELWDQILKDYDEIVHIPMSSGLSGSCQTAMMLAQEYDNRVFVVDSQRISVTQKYDVIDAKRLADQGKSGQEICDILTENKLNASIYITVNTLDYLKKGGRITPAAALLGGMLKIKPILQIQGEKLDSFAKTRTMARGTKIMKEAIAKDIKERFDDDYHNVHICVAYTYDEAPALELKKELEELYPGENIICDPLSLSVSCHIGPHSLAIAICKKI